MSRKRINEIDLSRWREYEHVWTDSLWLIGPRDRSGGHQLDYHGNFVPQIATQLMTRYTCKNDIVLDLFLGSGTSAIEAARLERRCIGVELEPELVEYVRRKLKAAQASVQVLQGDSAAPSIVPRPSAGRCRPGSATTPSCSFCTLPTGILSPSATDQKTCPMLPRSMLFWTCLGVRRPTAGSYSKQGAMPGW